MKDIIMTVTSLILMGLIMGKAVVSALANITAWVMTKLADIGKFDIHWNMDDYAKFYMEHSGYTDIEH